MMCWPCLENRRATMSKSAHKKKRNINKTELLFPHLCSCDAVVLSSSFLGQILVQAFLSLVNIILTADTLESSHSIQLDQGSTSLVWAHDHVSGYKSPPTLIKSSGAKNVGLVSPHANPYTHGLNSTTYLEQAGGGFESRESTTLRWRRWFPINIALFASI